MTNENNEATLLGYRILFDSKGNLITERISVDIKKLKKSFSLEDYNLLRSVLSEAKTKLDKVHNQIETALNFRK
tara:strand:+ start:639 stop:860 length:222 start_codon:yes stop_codon:yes gene_type:complete